MIKNYLLITFRSLLKNKVFIRINVFGMGIAIACCIVGYLALEYNSNFDLIHKNGKHIYRVGAIRQFENKHTRFGHAPLPLGEIIDRTLQDVDGSSRYFPSWSNFKRNTDLFAANLSYTLIRNSFNYFRFDLISGTPSDLKDKTSVFISESMAIRLFTTHRKHLVKQSLRFMAAS